MRLINWGKKKPPKQTKKSQIVCPYCMREINPKEIPFLSASSNIL